MRTTAAGLLLAAATMTTSGTAVADDRDTRQCTVEGDGNTVVAPFCGATGAASSPPPTTTPPPPPTTPDLRPIPELPPLLPGLR